MPDSENEPATPGEPTPGSASGATRMGSADPAETDSTGSDQGAAESALGRTAAVLGRAASAIAHVASTVTAAVLPGADDHDEQSTGPADRPTTPADPPTTPAAQPAAAGSRLSTAVVAVVAGGFGTASRAALARLLDRLGVEQGSDAADLASFGEGLRSVAGLLGREPGLRRALTESARAAADRAGLAHRILDGHVAAPVATMVADSAADRWSAPRDLVDGLDVAATAAEVAAANQSGNLDSLEDDMFRFERIIDGDPELRSALSDRRAPAASRTALVHRLLDGKTSEAAVRLATAAVADLRGRSVETSLTEIQELVAALQDRVVAVVRVAAPLTPDQHARLAERLSKAVGHKVQLNVISDPSVVGGFRAEIGDTVIDASVAGRLADAKRRLVA